MNEPEAGRKKISRDGDREGRDHDLPRLETGGI